MLLLCVLLNPIASCIALHRWPSFSSSTILLGTAVHFNVFFFCWRYWSGGRLWPNESFFFVLDLGAVCPSSSETGLDWTVYRFEMYPVFPYALRGNGDWGWGSSVELVFPLPSFTLQRYLFFFLKSPTSSRWRWQRMKYSIKLLLAAAFDIDACCHREASFYHELNSSLSRRLATASQTAHVIISCRPQNRSYLGSACAYVV